MTNQETERMAVFTVGHLAEALANLIDENLPDPNDWPIETIEALGLGAVFLRELGKEVPEVVRWALHAADSPHSDGCPPGAYWVQRPKDPSEV